MAKTKVPGGYISDEAITSAHLHSSHGITTNDIGEHTNNKYYTDARVDARLAASKSANLFTTGNIEIGSDTGKLRLGTGADLRIYHNGATSFIDNFTGNLTIQQGVDDGDIILKCDDGSGGTTAYLTLDGSMEYTYVHKPLILGNNTTFKIGSNNALQMSHNGSNTFIANNVGILYLSQNVDDGVIHIRNDDGSGGVANYITLHGGTGEVRLAHYGNVKLATKSTGVDITGDLSLSGNLTVTGTTTTVNTVTMNAQNAVIFEGATADAHETTLTIIDPTADRTINLPNQSGTIPVLAAASNTAITATPAELNYVDGVTSAIQTQLNAKQATISSSTDLTLSSIVATSSNESRFNALSIGPDADIYLYQSATNEFTIRTGTSGAYKYFTFESGGNLNLLSGGLETGGTERISSGGNLTNIGTISSGAITSTGASSFGPISSGTITTSGNIIMNSSQYIDLNGSNIIDVDQINGIGASGWLDFNMDTDSVYPQSTTDNQTVLGSVTHMNFVGDSNANGTGGTFNFGYGVNHTDSGTFTKTMDLDRSGNLTVIGALTGTSLDINGTGDVSGNLSAGNVLLSATGSIELFRSNGAFIDFKDSSSDDFDSRIMGGNSLIFTVGGAGSTVTGLTLGSGAAIFGVNIVGSDVKAAGSGGLSLQTDEGTKRIEILDSGVVKFNQAYSFPTSDGSANQVLRTDGSGNLSFATVSSGGSGFSTITEPSAGQIKIGAQSGANEGGEILLENAAANGGGSYTTDIHLDNYQNQFRVHAAGSVLFSTQTGTGNTTVAGTLGVSGDLTASGNLTVDDKLTIGDATANSNSFIEFGERITASETNKPFIGQTNSGNSTSQDLGIGVRSGSGVIKFFAGNTAAFTESSVRATIANTYINFTEPLQMAGSEFIDENKKITLSSAHTKQKIEVYGGGHEWIGTSASTLELSGLNINFNGAQGSGSPVLQHGGTNIMDTNKNLVNIGTISSGKIEGTTADANGHILKTDSSTASASDVALQLRNSSSTYNLKFQPRLPSGNMHSGVNADDFGIFTSNSQGISIGNNDKSLVVIHPTDGIEFHTNNTNRFNITTAGNLQLNGTTVIDASRNLTNIGTITSSGNITANGTSHKIGNAAGSNLRVGPTYGDTDRDFIDITAHGTDTKVRSVNERFHIENDSNQITLLAGEGANVGFGTIAPAQKLAIVKGTNYDPPGLGSSAAHFAILKEDSVENGDYGLLMGVRSSGRAWIQTQRVDGTATGYDLELQPSGENVRIGADLYIPNRIRHTDDANTYFQFNAADTARIVVGGSQKFLVNSNGVHISNGYLDLNGNDITDTGNITIGTLNSTASGTLYLTGTTANKRGELNCSNGNIHMDADHGNGIYLNWYGAQSATSTAGTYFGDANGGQVARIDGSGNFTLSGTVDGRDVAADGTKLDGIAANANNYSFPYTISDNAGNSSVVRRTGNGYIFANYFNTTANDVSSGITKLACETSNDSYIRWGTAAAVRSFLNVADGANNITNTNQLTNGAGFITSSGTAANATQAGGLSVHTGTNNEANKIVRTQANGYIMAGWINTTSGSTTTAISRIYASNDAYIRYYTAANYFNAGGMGEKQFNNQGRNHSSLTNFNTDMPAGVHYLQQGNNGPTGTASHQFYGIKFGLGNEYGTTSGSGQYSSQMYYPRAGQGGGNGLYFRDMEDGSFGSWRQVDAGTLGTLGLSTASATIGANQVMRTDGNAYMYSHWINVGTQGIYSGTNGAHFYPNTLVSYGTWRINGTRGGYSGIVMDGGGDVVVGMFDGSGNGGTYRPASSKWYHYYHLGNTCMGINGSGTSSSYALYVSGAIYATGDVVGSSDERLKTEIKTIPNALDKVLQLRGVTYKWIDPEEGGTCVNNITETRMGVIAQEIVDVVPEVVTHDKENDRYGVSYGHLTGILIEAVKELKQEVNELKKELEEVKNG